MYREGVFRKNERFLNRWYYDRDIEWPICDCDILGKMYIPMPDEVLKYEEILPFLNDGLFPKLDLDVQVDIWKHLNRKNRAKIMEQLTKEEQVELINAIVREN